MSLRLIALCILLSPLTLFSQIEVDTKGVLPEEISETSGLIFHNGKLITHNDSANDPKLYEIDTISLKVTRTVTITNVENLDWEDITQDETYIYIGDFGNNKGTRKDLAIYRITKSDYDQFNEVIADRIDFAYEDQTDFSEDSKSDWDAEAIFKINDKLVVLTKQWESKGTVAYSIPAVSGDHIAKRIGSYQTEGLITGATYNSTSKLLYLIGYTTILSPFVVRVEGSNENAIFEGKVERSNLNINLSQVEGIAHVATDTYFFSSEFFSRESPPITLEPSLFSFKIESENEEFPIESPEEFPETKKDKLILYGEFGSDTLKYELTTDSSIFGQAIFDSTGKRVQYVLGTNLEGNTIDLSALRSSTYYLAFYLSDKIMSKPFIKY